MYSMYYVCVCMCYFDFQAMLLFESFVHAMFDLKGVESQGFRLDFLELFNRRHPPRAGISAATGLSAQRYRRRGGYPVAGSRGQVQPLLV